MSDEEENETTRWIEAAKVFLDHLRTTGPGQPAAFDELYSGHPEIATELRQLVALYEESPDRAAAMSEAATQLDTGSIRSAPRTRQTPMDGGSSRYRPEEEVAHGGMGIIYRVRDNDLRRTLAMKVIKPPKAPSGSLGASDAEALGRFLEEAQVTAQLDHPGIVPVHELGQNEDGKVFFTMKLVKGRNLQEIFGLTREEADGWNLSRAVGAMVKVCQAVAFAHSKGVVHRDLKPSNIMVGRFGEVYVMDWGLAKVIGKPDLHDLRFTEDLEHLSRNTIQSRRRDDDEDSEDAPLITMDGSVVGTPAYMASEQARGEIDEVDFSSDIYSLGAILYFLLAGQAPYLEPGARLSPRTVLARVIDGPPKAIISLNPDAPPELVAICEKAMTRDKTGRYETSMEMAEDLQAFLDGRVVRAYRTGPVAELRSWVARNRLAAGVAAAALAAILGIGGWWAYQEHVNARGLQHRLAEQFLMRGQVLCEAGQVDRGMHWFVRAIEETPDASSALRADIEANLFGWATGCNQLVEIFDHGWGDVQAGPRGTAPVFAFSADGERLITGGRADDLVRVWATRGGDQVLDPVDHGEPVNVVGMSDHGHRLVAIGATNVSIWTGTGEGIGRLRLEDARIACSAFDPSRSMIAVGGRDGTVAVWNVENGEPEARLRSRLGTRITAIALSPDGARLLAGDVEGAVQVWSLDSGEPSGDPVVLPASVSAVAFSPDGSRFAACDAEGSGRLISVATMEGIGSPISHDRRINRVLFSPDGSLFATCGQEFAAKLWSARDGSLAVPPMRHLSWVAALAFSPDSQLLLTGSADFNARLWDTNTGKMAGIEIARTGTVNNVAFSPDGGTIAVGAVGRVEFWTPALIGRPETIYPTVRTTWGVDFSPDGGMLVTGGFATPTRIWKRGGAEIVHEFSEDEGIWDAKFSPNGRHVLKAHWTNPDAATLATIAGEELARFPHDQNVRCVAFSRDGRMAATGSFDGTARVWTADTGEKVATLEHPDIVEDLVFSLDGSTLVTACSDGNLRFWSIESGAEFRAPLAHADAILAVEVSPDGRLIATGSRDHTARFWDMDTGDWIGPILEHANWVEDLAFSPDGARVITASSDRTVRIWTAGTGRQLGPPLVHDSAVRAVAYDPRSEFILSAAEEPGAKLWRIPQAASLNVTDHRAWVQGMTGRWMDEDGTLHRLSSDEWRKTRREAPVPHE